MIFVYLFSLLIIETISWGNSPCPWPQWPQIFAQLSDCAMDKSDCTNTFRQDLANKNMDCCGILDAGKCGGTGSGSFTCENSYCGGCYAVSYDSEKRIFGEINTEGCVMSGM